MLDVILKYRLWLPILALRMLYYNFVRIMRAHSKIFLVLARHRQIGKDRTAQQRHFRLV